MPIFPNFAHSHPVSHKSHLPSGDMKIRPFVSATISMLFLSALSSKIVVDRQVEVPEVVEKNTQIKTNRESFGGTSELKVNVSGIEYTVRFWIDQSEGLDQKGYWHAVDRRAGWVYADVMVEEKGNQRPIFRMLKGDLGLIHGKSGVYDLTGDGVPEIVCSVVAAGSSTAPSLYIYQFHKNHVRELFRGSSAPCAARPSYEFRDMDGDGDYEILVECYSNIGEFPSVLSFNSKKGTFEIVTHEFPQVYDGWIERLENGITFRFDHIEQEVKGNRQRRQNYLGQIIELYERLAYVHMVQGRRDEMYQCLDRGQGEVLANGGTDWETHKFRVVEVKLEGLAETWKRW